ncbi:Uncharacterised protein [uncultured Anaerotruncus sp.]|uniref:DUF6273 domain-containing protein n=1 Tax=uncultured Anaerotruncus sp. TaxID=905011 RepID=A0A6N2R6F7_9FIRM
MAEETTYLKGVLQDHTGNELLPKTQASQVETEDGSTVEAKLAAADAHLESKGHMFQVTASLTPSGALELTGSLPAEKDGLTVQFVSPAAATDGLQAKFAGSDTLYPILTTGEGKEPIQAGAWDQGVPVTLTVSGGNCFFKAGAGVNDTLPPQVTGFKAVDSSSGGVPKITVSWQNPTAFFAGILIVRKEGSAPTGVRDGVKVYTGTGTSYVDADVVFDTAYYYRAYPYNDKKQYQTLTNVVSVAPQPSKKLSELPVESLLKIKEDGVPVNYLVAHQGKPSSIYDASCDGTWLLRQDIAEERKWDADRNNTLESSDIRAYLNGTWINRYDANIKNAIKQVKIPYRQNGGSGGTDRTGANGLPCKIFLLSGYEVGWTTSADPHFPVDGAKLSYFTSGTSSAANNKRIAKLNGNNTDWWLRSPSTDGTKSVWYVLSNGDFNNGYAINSDGVRPALILPRDFLVKAAPNSDGSYSPIDD